MACLCVFPGGPAEMLLTLWLKIERLCVLTASVQVRSVVLMTGLFPFKYSWFVWTDCQVVEFLYLKVIGSIFRSFINNYIYI